MTVLASFSIKGGVGKSTTAVNIAQLAAFAGQRTLLWDLDPQGAASYYLKTQMPADFEPSSEHNSKRLAQYVVPTLINGLDAIPTRLSNNWLSDVLGEGKPFNSRLGTMLYPLLKDYDLVVLDCPPGLSSISVNALHAADITLVPTIPAALSVRTLRQLRKHIRLEGINTRLLSFFTMMDARRSSHRSIVEYHQGVNADDILETVIPYSAIIERMSTKRRPLALFAGTTEPALAYKRLYEELAPYFGLPKPDTSGIESQASEMKASASTSRLLSAKLNSENLALPTPQKAPYARRKVRPVRFNSKAEKLSKD